MKERTLSDKLEAKLTAVRNSNRGGIRPTLVYGAKGTNLLIDVYTDFTVNAGVETLLKKLAATYKVIGASNIKVKPDGTGFTMSFTSRTPHEARLMNGSAYLDRLAIVLPGFGTTSFAGRRTPGQRADNRDAGRRRILR